MATSANKFSLYWEITNSSKYTGAPTLQRTKNDLDSHGVFFDLPRLPGEDGVSYYKRLQSVIPLRAGSDKIGLVHGITRELGLEEKIGLEIVPVYAGSTWKAPSPRVEVTATEIILYSEWWAEDDYTIDTTIDIFDHGDGYLLDDVVSEIQQSEYFVAELGPQMTGTEKSNGLMPASSIETVSKEAVPPSTYFFLENTDIIPGTVSFSEKTVFQTELSPAVATPVTGGITLSWVITFPAIASGQYYIDYDRGIVSLYSAASGGGTVRYQYRNFPFRIRWSPVVVYSLRDSIYREKLFETETMLDNSERQGLVTSEGSQVYSQLFEKVPSLWGV